MFFPFTNYRRIKIDDISDGSEIIYTTEYEKSMIFAEIVDLSFDDITEAFYIFAEDVGGARHILYEGQYSTTLYATPNDVLPLSPTGVLPHSRGLVILDQGVDIRYESKNINGGEFYLWIFGLPSAP